MVASVVAVVAVYLRYVRVCFEGKYLRVSDKSLRLGLAFSCMIDTFQGRVYSEGAGIPIGFNDILCDVLLKKLGGFRCGASALHSEQ